MLFIHSFTFRISFKDDDYSPDEIPYDPSINSIHSTLINSCLTITEENEEELEQLKRDDDEEEQKKQNHLLKINDGSIPTVTLHDNDDRADILENDDQINKCDLNTINMNNYQDNEERLSTIYESPSPQPRIEEEEEDIYDEAYDKLIVYDKSVEKGKNINSKLSPIISPSSSIYRSPILDRSRIRSCYADASFKTCSIFPTTQSASNLCGTTTMITSKVFHQPIINNDDKNSFSSPVINNRNIHINKSLASLPTAHQSPSKFSPISLSVPMLLLPVTYEHTTSMMDNNKSIPTQHIRQMKVIQSSSSSLSDFIIPTPTSTLRSSSRFCLLKSISIICFLLAHYEEVPSVHHSLTDCSSIPHISYCAPLIDEDLSTRNDNQRRPSFTRRILTNGLLLSHCSSSNPTHRRVQPPLTFNQQRYQTKPKSEEKLSSPIESSSSSSESNSPSGEKFMSKSDFLLQQQQQNLSQQRKASSLKTISDTSNQQPSKILYPIDFQTNNNEQSWYQKNSSNYNKVPTSDSGIVIDTAGTLPTSKSSIDEVRLMMSCITFLSH
jgi:hypothetical protein